MTRPPHISPEPDDLHAWVDGQLPDAQAQQQFADADPATRATLQAWQAQRQALQALHRDVLQEPIPASMLAPAHAARSAAAPWRWAAMAASVCMAFALGWLSHGQWPGSRTGFQQAGLERDFVRHASVAHAVYLPEKRHPVEVGANEQEHLVQWLSKRLGRTLKVPDLGAQGYSLVGGRLLPGDSGARAQFMFQNPEGSRLTLYLGGLTAADTQANLRETRFQYEQQGRTGSFYWFDQDFGYALCAELPRARLLQLATLVYQQLGS
jgi:anti-sigma factor RsiW